MALVNKWQYGVRIDNFPRDALPNVRERFLHVEWFDPRERISSTNDEARKERVRERWPDLDLLRVILPIDEQFDYQELHTFIEEHGIRSDQMDIILGLKLEDDTEYTTIPSFVLNVIREFRCEVTVNITKF